MSSFFQIPIKKIRKLTEDSANIVLDLSSVDSETFSFKSGQYITIEHEIGSENVRRSYSISSSPEYGIEIGVKLVPNGLMSTFLTTKLKERDILKVMPPTGNFILDIDKKNENQYVGICAGSGITPILSMIKNVINNEPNSSFTLIYGNKSQSSVMYSEEVIEFQKNHREKFRLFSTFCEEKVENAYNGIIDKNFLTELFGQNDYLKKSTSFFICGPGNMNENVSDFLKSQEIDDNKINFELFSAPTTTEEVVKKEVSSDLVSNVTVCVDGDDFDFELEQSGQTILDAAIEAGADVPFSCKGGVCSVCKAKVMEGSASMDMNYSLSEEDVDEGFILTCQAHPTSENIFVDFDEM